MENRELEMQALYYKALQDYKSPGREQHEEGLHFLNEASEMGSAEADKMLGVLYMSGQYAPYPEKDMDKALECYHKAAEAGDSEAMYWICQCYEMGLGVDQNAELADEWREKAYAAGFEPEEVAEEEQPEEEKPAEPEAHLPEYVNYRENESIAPEEARKPKGLRRFEAGNIKGAPVILPQVYEIEEDQNLTEEERAAREVQREKDSQSRSAQILQAFEQTNEANAKQRSWLHPLKYALACGGIIFAVFMLIGLLLMLLVDLPKEGSYRTIYWSAVVIIGLALGGFSGFVFWGRGKDKAQQIDRWEISAFFYGFRGDLPKEEYNSWLYRVYRGMVRTYVHARCGHEIREDAFEAPGTARRYGVIIPGWCFKNRQEFVRPDFVIATEKAIFVVRAHAMSGRLYGDIWDANWTLRLDGSDSKDAGSEAMGIGNGQYMRTIHNLSEENDYALQIVRTELCKTVPEIDRIPFFNVLLFSNETDIRGLKIAGAPDYVSVLQGGAEKLRAQINMVESYLMPHYVDMHRICESINEIGSRQMDRQEELRVKAAGGEMPRTTFHSLNRSEFTDN